MTWLDEMRGVAVVRVAHELGLVVHKHPSGWSMGPCPACGAERRHPKRRDKRGAIGVSREHPEGWRCYQCDAAGDALDLAAHSLERARYRELVDEARARVQEWCERLLARPVTREAEAAGDEREPFDYPPVDEVAALWAACSAAREGAAGMLERRRIDPERVVREDLARVLPADARAPAWAGTRRSTWAAGGYRLLVPQFDAAGELRSVIARYCGDRDVDVKSFGPKGHKRAGLVLACARGRAMLAGQHIAERVVIAEGEIDFLAWATEPRGEEPFAVLGIVSGSWTPELAARISRGAVVVIATDHDAQGEEYAAKIGRSLAKRVRRGDVTLERWKLPKDAPKSAKDAGDVRAAGLPLIATGERVNPPRQAGREREDAPSEGATDGEGFEAGAKLSTVPAFAKAPIPDELVVPPGYRVGPDGSVWTKGKCVAREVPLIGRILHDVQTHEMRVEIVFRRAGKWQSRIVDRSTIIAGGSRFAQALGALGAPVLPKNAHDVAQWVACLEAANEARLATAIVTERAGWHELTGGEHVFVLGGHALDASGRTSARVVFDDRSDRAGVARHLRTGGDEDAHLELLRDACAASDAAACSVYAALAAPLLRRLGAPSFVVHFVGPSSRGKTTSLSFGAGVYGSPEVRGGQGWVASWDATSVGLEHRAQLSNDLPLCLDEAGLVPAEQRERDVYMLVAGQGRTRGAAAGGLRATASWTTVVISTGEEQLVRSERAHAGAQVRVVQLHVDGMGTLTGAEVKELSDRARAHFGHVGRRWIGQLLELDDWTALAKRYRELVRELRETLGARSSLEQRQAEAFAALELAAELAAPWLGLENGGAVRRVARESERRVEVIPEWQRALAAIAEWRANEPGAFPELEPDGLRAKRTRVDPSRRTASILVGYVDRTPGIAEHAARVTLCLNPGPVREMLLEHGLSLDTCAREWRREGILIPDASRTRHGGERLQRRVTIDGVRHWRLVLDLPAVEAVLGDAGSPDGEPDPPPAERWSRDKPAQLQLESGQVDHLDRPDRPAEVRTGAHARTHAHTPERAHAHVNHDQGDPVDPGDPIGPFHRGSSGQPQDHPADHPPDRVVPASEFYDP